MKTVKLTAEIANEFLRLQTGNWPNEQIDHINHVRDDNCWVNLREASQQENGRNASIPSTNTSGVLGVYLHKQAKKWRAQIRIDGKNKHLGLFLLRADAAIARKAAEVKHGYHENHGRSLPRV